MRLKDQIDDIRKNPKAYVIKQMDLYNQSLEGLDEVSLLCLLYAANAFEFDEIFEATDAKLKELPGFFENKEFLYFYHQAHGLYNRGLQRNNEAMKYLSRSYDLALQLDVPDYIGRSLMLISTIFDMNQDHETAISYAKRSIDLCGKISSSSDIADIYMNHALLLDHAGRPEEALSGFHFAEKTYKKLADCETYLNYSVILFNISKAYIAISDMENGKVYLDLAMKIGEAQGFLGYFTRSIHYIAGFYKEHGQIEKANEILTLYLDHQQRTINYRIKAIANRHRQDFLPHFESLHQLYQNNTQLVREINALQNAFLSDDGKIEINEKRLIKIIAAIRNDEFVPYLQPIWSMETKEVIGAEMLARWHKPDGVVLTPADFIEAIEHTDFMAVMTEKLVKQTLEKIGSFIRNQSPDFKLSINASSYQLATQNLVGFLELCCAEFGVSPHNIAVEIVERTFIENDPKAISQLFALAEKGFSVALDDFGSGYSSLSCVVSLPVDTVKIDRSLIMGLKSGERSEKLLRSIVAMVTELDMDTVAEGIENEEQWQIVKETGCKVGQGYMVGKPCNIDDCSWLCEKPNIN